MSFLYLLLLMGLVFLHLFAGKLRWLDLMPRYRWFSLGAGISIAYIFLDILPELNKAQEEIEHSGSPIVEDLENHVYILALIGLAAFYGLELLAQRSRQFNRKTKESDCTSLGVFWVHIGSFAIYNALIGDLLSDAEERGLVSALLLFVALAGHFIVNDYSLREHHKHDYDRRGRWVLAGAIILGWVLGNSIHLDEVAIATIWAFVAGGIILNVLKEEIPENRESCFWSFLVGAGVYSVLLLAV